MRLNKLAPYASYDAWVVPPIALEHGRLELPVNATHNQLQHIATYLTARQRLLVHIVHAFQIDTKNLDVASIRRAASERVELALKSADICCLTVESFIKTNMPLPSGLSAYNPFGDEASTCMSWEHERAIQYHNLLACYMQRLCLILRDEPVYIPQTDPAKLLSRLAKYSTIRPRAIATQLLTLLATNYTLPRNILGTEQYYTLVREFAVLMELYLRFIISLPLSMDKRDLIITKMLELGLGRDRDERVPLTYLGICCWLADKIQVQSDTIYKNYIKSASAGKLRLTSPDYAPMLKFTLQCRTLFIGLRISLRIAQSYRRLDDNSDPEYNTHRQYIPGGKEALEILFKTRGYILLFGNEIEIAAVRKAAISSSKISKEKGSESATKENDPFTSTNTPMGTFLPSELATHDWSWDVYRLQVVANVPPTTLIVAKDLMEQALITATRFTQSNPGAIAIEPSFTDLLLSEDQIERLQPEILKEDAIFTPPDSATQFWKQIFAR